MREFINIITEASSYITPEEALRFIGEIFSNDHNPYVLAAKLHGNTVIAAKQIIEGCKELDPVVITIDHGMVNKTIDSNIFDGNTVIIEVTNQNSYAILGKRLSELEDLIFNSHNCKIIMLFHGHIPFSDQLMNRFPIVDVVADDNLDDGNIHKIT